MKNKRVYNVFFNTHTVSGIIISVGLFVCFLAGAFALFQTNINKWESNVKNGVHIKVDYEQALATIKQAGYTMDGRTFFIRTMDNPSPYIMVASRPIRGKRNTKKSVAKATLPTPRVSPNRAISIKIDPKTSQIIDSHEGEPTHHLGSFLYHLHYFDQIPLIGIYLSGIVAIFFLFAIVTGTIIHWKKIVSNFFTFRLKASIKNLWTDAHVALGIIGLPFQFMYAVTGALFGLTILVLLPPTLVLFNGNQGELIGYTAPAYKGIRPANEALTQRPNINELVKDAHRQLNIDQPLITSVFLTNYNDNNARLMVEFKAPKERAFLDDAYITYRLRDQKIVEKKTAEQHAYKGGALHTLRKLHFGQFGGYFIKAIYFLLALVTCFVILSGVMVWLEARNNKRYAHKRRFNTNVGIAYLGISLGLFPAIAFFFCLTKVLPITLENRFELMSNAFFIFWLGYVVYSFMLKDFHKINKHALFLTGVLGIFVPILNGMQSNLWFWKSLRLGYVDSFFIDLSWLLLGTVSLITAFYVKRLASNKEKRKVSKTQRTVQKSVQAEIN